MRCWRRGWRSGPGLPVPVTEVVEVDEWLVEHTPELSIQLAHNTIRCQAGLQFGSRYVVSPLEGQVLDYLPVEMLERVRNLETFPGMLVLDKWTGNANGRQAAFWRSCGRRSIRRRLSIRDIASTRGSGRFRIIRCAGFLRGMKCMRACGGGSRLSRGCRGWRRWRRSGVGFGGGDSSGVVWGRVGRVGAVGADFD